MCWTWSLLGHVHLSLCQKRKLRVDNAVNNLFVALTQLWILCTLTHGLLRVDIMRNALESVVKRTKRDKEVV